jgi:hypothetical protein
MNKKLLSLIMLLCLSLSIFSFSSKATTTYYITWSSVNLFSTVHQLKGVGPIGQDDIVMTINIPDSIYHRNSLGGVDSYIEFYTGASKIGEFDLVELFGLQLYGEFIFDLDSLGVLAADNFIIGIMQSYTATPGGYIAYITSEYSISFSNVKPFDQQITWNNTNLYSTFYAITATLIPPVDFEIFAFSLPKSQFHLFSVGGVDSVIELYDIADDLIETIDLNTIGTFTSGVFKFKITDYDLDIGDVRKINILIAQSYSILPTQYISYLNENTTLQYNLDLLLVQFYVSGQVQESFTFTDIPEEFTFSVDLGTRFEYWVMANGQPYYFDKVVTNEMTINGVFNLYAYVISITDITTPTPTEPVDITPTNLLLVLNVFGLDNGIGYVVFWFIVTMAVTVLGLVLRIPFFAIIVLNIIATSFIVYLGMLSFLLIITIYSLYGVTLFFSLKGGLNE